ncbi:hypothetical protein ACQP2U_14465 [Nocardia sp. CA-084685]|uniref:hypothetical protein n=1 Tax=Nocardia sp. CA-084685 TaxID=3239970 RepID=UPI003D99B636
MIHTQSSPSGTEPLGPVLLDLDPDLEQLFAEVDQILREALARVPGTPRVPVPVPVPVPRSGPRVRPANREYFARLRGRRPTTGRATQRSPPLIAGPCVVPAAWLPA